jgi:hypothetical protein
VSNQTVKTAAGAVQLLADFPVRQHILLCRKDFKFNIIIMAFNFVVKKIKAFFKCQKRKMFNNK